MNRRGFLSTLVKGTIGTAAVVVAGGELWTPGKVTHFLAPKGGWNPIVMSAEMQAAITQSLKGLFANAGRIREDYLKDREFLYGDQWPEDVRAARAAAGRPTLTINRIPSLANMAAQRATDYNPEREFIYRRVASDPALHDLQRLYNYQLSACAELMSMAPAAPILVSGRQMTALQPTRTPGPLDAALTMTGQAMYDRVRALYPQTFD